MKHRITITYKNGEIETFKIKGLMIENGNIHIELLEKVMRPYSPHPEPRLVGSLYIKFYKVKEITIK